MSGFDKIQAFYIAGTHWDREWYEPFQEYRMWLVQTIDHVLDLLDDDPEYKVFHLDGQAVMLEDYLEIRPEQRARLLTRLEEGKLIAGPWYCQPDELLISGEAFIRNLSLGIRITQTLGVEPMKEGYCPDMFGHISSLPVIFAGFGFKHVVLWRGASEKKYGSQFVWKGTDDESEIIVTKLPDDGGYSAFLLSVRKDDPLGENLEKLFQTYLETQRKYLTTPLLYLSDANDHKMAVPETTQMLARLKKAFPDVEIRHASMLEYFDELEKYRDRLPSYQGELRDPTTDFDALYQFLIPHCISSRYPLKLNNDQCQNLLELWSEPLAALVRLREIDIPSGFLHQAWKYLLKNQPHDSICGCSIDQAHSDMQFRYDQCRLLGDGIRRQSMAKLSLPTADLHNGYQNVVIHNSLPWSRSDVVEIDLLFPYGFQPKGVPSGMVGSEINQFELVTDDERVLDYQLVSIKQNRLVKAPNEMGRNQTVMCDVYRVALRVELPACGYRTIQIRPLKDKMHRAVETMRTAPLSAENQFFSITVHTNGSVDIFDRTSEIMYSNLFMYEDTGDTGDGWIYVRPIEDNKVLTFGQVVRTSVENDGPFQVVFRIDRKIELPRSSGSAPGGDREEEIEVVHVVDRLIVRKDCPYLLVKSTIDNTAEDHRLRVLFPSNIEADSYFADQPFTFVERPVALDNTTFEGREMDPEERPHLGMFGICDRNRGLAILCPAGLHEHSVYDDADRTLALTLYRSIGRTVQTNGEPGGQLLESMNFSYALYPFSGKLSRFTAVRKLQELRAGAYTHISNTVQPVTSLLNIIGEVVTTAIKPATDGNGIVVRVWNPGDVAAEAGIQIASSVSRAVLCNLNEEEQQEVEVTDNTVKLQVPPMAVRTVRIF